MCGNFVIANKSARWGRGERFVRRAAEFFEGREFEYSLFVSDSAGHCRQLGAKAASEGAKTVIVVGGDGTINEVVNGMLGSGVDQVPRIGIIPAGSSNDLSKSIGIPQELERACETILRGRVKVIDV
ncbi:MAG: diacylglycerol/lipid kinase family protein, partial [Planctomycetota bacterium]